MGIQVTLDAVLERRGMRGKELTARIGVSETHLADGRTAETVPPAFGGLLWPEGRYPCRGMVVALTAGDKS
jgi:hypothetical protein